MNFNPFYWIDLKAQKDSFEEGKRLGLIAPDAVFVQKPMTTIKEIIETRRSIFP